MTTKDKNAFPARILVPTDFSSTSEKAFRFALDLAYRAGGTVLLYHVYKPLKTGMVDLASAKQAINEETEISLMKKLQRFRNRIQETDLRYQDLAISAVLGHTPVVDNILGFAEDSLVDLIVMGTQGISGLRKTIIGSVAEKIIEHAAVPVIIVPQHYAFHKPGTIVFATNYQDSDRQAMEKVLGLSGLFKSTVVVTHLLNAYEFHGAGQMEKEQMTFEDYARFVQREFSHHRLRFELLEATSHTEALADLQKKVPYDMIAMVRRKKSFLDRLFLHSFSEEMLYATTCPLMILPGDETG